MAGKGEGPAIGIDLGTTYSCVGVWQHDRVEIIANDQGNRTTPSYVGFTDSERLIGDAAKNQVAMNPINTVFESNLEVDLRYIPLFNAALRGDWDAATGFFDQDEKAITAPITKSFETALYIAVGTGERAIHFVENLVELMPVQSLIYQEIGGFTALHTAAWVGNTRAAAVLVRQNPDLLYILDKDRKLPLHLAAENARKDTLLFLLAVTKDDHVCMPFSGDSGVRDDHVSMPFSRDSGVRLVNYAISSRFYDVALSLVQRYPELARSKDDNNKCALGSIATKASAFPSGSGLNFWQRIIYYNVPVKLETDSIKYPSRGDIENPSTSSQVIVQKHVWSIWAQLLKDFSISVPLVKHIRDQKQMHLQALTLLKCVCEEIRYSNAYISFSKEAIIIASRIGTHEVIQEIVDSFPKLVWTSDGPEKHSIFQRAIIDRQENVFNLIYQMGDHKEYAIKFRDIRGNNMLHLAGRLAPQNKLDKVPGAALQMQRELQWFKEVEKQVQPGYAEWQNDYEETPAMVFTKEHKELLKEGQKWMKETANSCTIAAALIVTVVFAAAITVPGGNNNDTGLPMFSKKTVFITFVVSDAIAFFTSTTSLLMFLSILTSRYAESDFLHVLPQRLIIGLLTLFLSITTMVVAFSATLYLVFGHDKAWILIPVAVLASLPVTSFMSLQFPLLLDLISSTYGSGIFGKQSDRPFY